jgi:hypothetical protein
MRSLLFVPLAPFGIWLLRNYRLVTITAKNQIAYIATDLL